MDSQTPDMPVDADANADADAMEDDEEFEVTREELIDALQQVVTDLSSGLKGEDRDAYMDTRYVHREDPDEEAKLGGYKVLFEFYMPSRAEVEAKYNEMVGYGYRSYHSPFETTFGMYFALVDDPDGNTVLLSAS